MRGNMRTPIRKKKKKGTRLSVDCITVPPPRVMSEPTLNNASPPSDTAPRMKADCASMHLAHCGNVVCGVVCGVACAVR